MFLYTVALDIFGLLFGRSLFGISIVGKVGLAVFRTSQFEPGCPPVHGDDHVLFDKLGMLAQGFADILVEQVGLLLLVEESLSSFSCIERNGQVGGRRVD